MSLDDEIVDVRRTVQRLADESEPVLLRRYALWHPVGERRTLCRRLRRALGRVLRAVRLRPTAPVEPWRVDLEHAGCGDPVRPFVIWAIGADRQRLAQACVGFRRMLQDSPGRVPVLVTDVADFRAFSRLGWLVEYVPRLSEPASAYGNRKLRHLAALYRDVPVLPVSAGLARDVTLEQLRLD